MWQVVSRCGGQSLLHIAWHALPVYIVATLLIRAIKFILCRELVMTANRTVQERNAICRIVDSAESLTRKYVSQLKTVHFPSQDDNIATVATL